MTNNQMPNVQLEKQWLDTQIKEPLHQNGICQCGSENVIRRSYNPKRVRATLLSLVFFDQFIYTHFRWKSEEFKRLVNPPQLVGHSFGGHASPSWFVYSRHGYDQKADWDLITSTFQKFYLDIKEWLGADITNLESLIGYEFTEVFESNQLPYFERALED